MRKLDGCSTPAPRPSAAKQWFEELSQKVKKAAGRSLLRFVGAFAVNVLRQGRQPTARVPHLAHQAIFNGTQKLHVRISVMLRFTQDILTLTCIKTYVIGTLNDLKPRLGTKFAKIYGELLSCRGSNTQPSKWESGHSTTELIAAQGS